MLTIGCHLSSSGGFLAMGKTAVSIGANTFQFFTRNPRGGAAKAIDPEDVSSFLAYAEENGIGPIVAHAPYTLNACAEKDSVLVFARETMADDLQRMELLPGTLYNFHPGSHVGQGVPAGIDRIAETLNAVLQPDLHTTVLLETMAGKGSEIGSRFEELASIIDRVSLNDRLGVCLDTCHVYDAGYDIVGRLDDVLSSFDNVLGLDRLKAVHLNDSKNPFASHKDRHEVIGGGSIGTDAFVRIITHPVLSGLPFCLETPNDLSGYADEIQKLRTLYNEKQEVPLCPN